MRNIISISLPDKLSKKLAQEAKQENDSRSAIVKKALKQHFFVRDFIKLRNEAISELSKKGITVTEEQVFDNIS